MGLESCMSIPFASYIFTLSLENSNCLSTNKDYSAGKSTLIWQLNRINVHSEPTKRASFETTRCIYGGQKKKRRKGTHTTITLKLKTTHSKMSHLKRGVLKDPFSSLLTSQVCNCMYLVVDLGSVSLSWKHGKRQTLLLLTSSCCARCVCTLLFLSVGVLVR